MSINHIARMIRDSVGEHAALTAMRYREGRRWKEMTYGEMGALIDRLAKALIAAGVAPGDTVGIFSHNRPEWSLADFAVLSARAVSVPVYATSTAQQVEYIAADAGLSLIFAGSAEQYGKVKSFLNTAPKLKTIVVFDGKVPVEGNGSISFDDFLKRGETSGAESAVEARLADAAPGDVATIIYTSGTTGDPKGVMLTHANFFSQFQAVDAAFRVTERDRSLCFLPLSHSYERAWSFYIFRQGACNHYAGDARRAALSLPEVRPTAMVSVPLLYEKIYAAANERAEKSSPARRRLFRWAVDTGKKYAYRKKEGKFAGPWLRLSHAVADRMVLAKIRDTVGGPKNFFAAGGAALSREIEEFFFAAGLLVCQGYGLTETSPMISYNTPGAFRFGTVGRPIPGCQVRISEEGEILAKGPNVMKGYHNRPDETARTIVDGWLHTGDVGVIDDEGYITITDRIKDLIITSQGKNVAPQHIESTLCRDRFVEQVCCVGDGRSQIGALVVPSFPALEEYAGRNGIAFSSRRELVARPEVVAFYRQRLRDLSSELAEYEWVKRFALMPREFTLEEGEITPTMKIRRKVIMENYRDVIDRMYAGGQEPLASPGTE